MVGIDRVRSRWLRSGGNGKPIGVLCATERGDGGSFGSEDLSLLQIMALQIGPLIARLRGRGKAETAAEADRVEAESQIAVDPTQADFPATDGGAAEDAELARAICDVLTSEVEPDRVIRASLAVVANGVSAAPVSLYLLRSNGRELVLESQCERAGPGQIGRSCRSTPDSRASCCKPVGWWQPMRRTRTPRFDPEVDTPEGGEATPMLCVPISFRNKTMGVMRVFLESGVSASARTGEILAAAISAAVRNALLHRGLLDCVDEVAKARRENRPPG